MYPNFNNKQDRDSKHRALLARIARDQRLEAIKKEAYANAIWATDSEQNKLKDATETGDTLSRIMAAMKSTQSTTTPGVGDIYEAMGDAAQENKDAAQPNPNAGVFSSVSDAYEAMGDQANKEMPMEDKDTLVGSQDPAYVRASLDATFDVPMLEESTSPVEEVSVEKVPVKKAEPVDDYNPIKDDIKRLFNRYPYLSNFEFKPVIIKEGEIQQHNYRISSTDASVLSDKGRKVRADNKILQHVDWSKTRDAIFDKVSTTNRRADKIGDILDRQSLKALFKRWRATTDALDPMTGYSTQLEARDDQEMEDMSYAERLEFNDWLSTQGYESPYSPPASNKRALEDSTVSLDTRVSKKGAEHTQMTKKASVEYLYGSIDGLGQLKLRPYVKVRGETRHASKIYLGDDMSIHKVADDEEIIDEKLLNKINRQVDWTATLNYVIGELSSGVRALNIDAGKETDPKEQSLKYIRVKHILDMIKVVDPKQGSQDEELLKFETPAPRVRKVSKGISPAKKDYVFEPPAGKGLIGRGLTGAGILKKNRSYNLADIEGSGKASDLKYKRLGSKFIRKADLNSNRLKLVFPNRTSVGPIRTMSNELTEMVKDLLYNDNINQQAYRDLSIEDQRVFYEIVKKTHVEHTLQTPMADPRLTLRAEFDKMRGEIALGNDNPDMLRELYRLATDMFEQKMLSSKEFRMKDPVVDTPKQHPSPDWIHGKKAGATVWANEPRERKAKTFKL
ncbi:unnamed protein product [Phytophthora lilii]|uniref:Unnamed protein product n=1 Tax=Phytophthora lilii TaxID=2077276 RepID=A0A9W7CHY5_9STRA|nr:unnamed protein product [Phytophthora lilii]